MKKYCTGHVLRNPEGELHIVAESTNSKGITKLIPCSSFNVTKYVSQEDEYTTEKDARITMYHFNTKREDKGVTVTRNY